MLTKVVLTAIMAFIISLSVNNIFAKNIKIAEDSAYSKKADYPQVDFDNSKLYSEDSRKMVNDWFTYYSAMKNSLATGNAVEAQKYGVEFLDAVNTSMPVLMKSYDSDDLKSFNKSMSDIRTKMTSASDIQDQRKLFMELNQSMMPFLKSSGMYDKSLYILTCPDDEMFGNSIWFSDAVDTTNPYLGPSGVSDCIIVKENWRFK